ncbi:MAG: 30S ribosomal protein S17e [Candidatus Aenigmarchaeota archaeon]|nr:30S ribosomal protein S17e [Candidatus Aenigmarchaeota archaeon]
MGRIKTTFVKNIGKELMEKHPESFSVSFEDNKKALTPFVSFTSRKIRNLVAGYITSVKNVKSFVQINRTEETVKDDRFGKRGRRRISRRR